MARKTTFGRFLEVSVRRSKGKKAYKFADGGGLCYIINPFHEKRLIKGQTKHDVFYKLRLMHCVDLSVPIKNNKISGKNIYSYVRRL